MLGMFAGIFGRVAVLVVRLRREESPECCLFRGNVGRGVSVAAHSIEGISLQELCYQLKNQPLVLVVTGYGIICKESEDGIGTRVLGNDEFLWSFVSEKGGTERLAFVRRIQMEPLLEILKNNKCVVLQTRVQPFGEHQTLAELGTLLSPTISGGNPMAAFMARKLQLPLLLLLLLLLGINMPVNRSLREKFAQQQEKHARLRGVVAERRSWSEKTERLLSEFTEPEDWQPCLLADRIASLVPENLVLEELTVNPLKSSLEELKPLRFERYVLIGGYVGEAAGVTAFTRRLADHDPAWEVHLVSLSRSKEKKGFAFKINIYGK